MRLRFATPGWLGTLLPALLLYGEPPIWAAKRRLEGIDFNPLESLHPLHRAYFEE